jgi:hypothetical protein
MTGGHTIRSRRDGDVLVVSVSGRYLPETHAQIMRLVVEELEVRPVRALVIDLLAAEHVMNPRERARTVVEPASSGDSLGLPTAIVVKAVMFETVSTVCAEMWGRGHRWVTLRDVPTSLQWASQRRPHWRRFADS